MLENTIAIQSTFQQPYMLENTINNKIYFLTTLQVRKYIQLRTRFNVKQQ